MIIVYDTETNGLPKSYKDPITNVENWPRAIQVAWALYENSGEEHRAEMFLVTPNGWEIPEDAAKVHGITMDRAMALGQSIDVVLNLLMVDIIKSDLVVGHNIRFDQNVLGAELVRLGRSGDTLVIPSIDTMTGTVKFCKIPGKFGFKWPKLGELYKILFNEDLADAHDALNDVRATAKCFFELRKLGVL